MPTTFTEEEFLTHCAKGDADLQEYLEDVLMEIVPAGSFLAQRFADLPPHISELFPHETVTGVGDYIVFYHHDPEGPEPDEFLRFFGSGTKKVYHFNVSPKVGAYVFSD